MKTTMILCLFAAISMVMADDYYGQDNPNFHQHEAYKVAPILKSKHDVIKPCLNYGLFEDPNDCGAFFQCSPAGLVRVKCAKGTLFDRNIKRCNTKEFVTCYSGISCPHPYGLFPDPRFCNKFLNCFKNIPYVQACPAGLVFNAVAPGKGFCDYPKYVHCGGKEIAVIKVYKPVIVKHPVHIPVEQPIHKPVERPVYIKVHKEPKNYNPIDNSGDYAKYKRSKQVEHPVYTPVVKETVYNPVVKETVYTPVVKETVYAGPRYDNDD
ncbi:hypothetical protein SNE40_004127 [Patella caerulea]|uniref:Chitin-binding type-2 domain-containing protein n=1 Tax=Patella caerulea TaxID=87958 RepID=A0AAN8KB65_PATCE